MQINPRLPFLAVMVFFLACAGRAGAESSAFSAGGPAEELLFFRINEARANPWAEAQRLGLNVIELRARVGERVASQWDTGLMPLAWNDGLASAGFNHVFDMLTRVYYSHFTPEGLGPDDRMRATGYEPMFWGESLGALAFLSVIPVDFAANVIYEGLMRDAFNQGKEGGALLDPLLREIGISMGGGRLALGENSYNVYVLNCVFGRSLPVTEPGYAELWGHVYLDANTNGRYDMGEGLEGIPLDVQGPLGVYGPTDPVQRVVSAREGAYRLPLLPGGYLVTPDFEGSGLEQPLYIQTDALGFSPLDIAVTGGF